jgi:hypothetical protein
MEGSYCYEPSGEVNPETWMWDQVIVSLNALDFYVQTARRSSMADASEEMALKGLPR